MREPSLVLTFKYKSCRRLVDPGADTSGTNECSSDSISALKWELSKTTTNKRKKSEILLLSAETKTPPPLPSYSIAEHPYLKAAMVKRDGKDEFLVLDFIFPKMEPDSGKESDLYGLLKVFWLR